MSIIWGRKIKHGNRKYWQELDWWDAMLFILTFNLAQGKSHKAFHFLIQLLLQPHLQPPSVSPSLLRPTSLHAASSMPSTLHPEGLGTCFICLEYTYPFMAWLVFSLKFMLKAPSLPDVFLSIAVPTLWHSLFCLFLCLLSISLY